MSPHSHGSRVVRFYGKPPTRVTGSPPRQGQEFVVVAVEKNLAQAAFAVWDDVLPSLKLQDLTFPNCLEWSLSSTGGKMCEMLAIMPSYDTRSNPTCAGLALTGSELQRSVWELVLPTLISRTYNFQTVSLSKSNISFAAEPAPVV